MNAQRFSAPAIVALLLAGCGGGGGGGSVPTGTIGSTSAPPQQVPAGGSAPLGIAITVPGASGAASSRTPRYISPSTASLTVTLQGAGAPLATVNVTPASAGCSPVPLGTLCTATVNAPVGANSYVVTTFDAVNAGGHQLGTATLTATIAANATNALALIINGVVANATAVLGTSSILAGTAASVSVNVVAYDAAGNVIVGPGAYSTPITLVNSDTSGQTTLSPTTVTAPGQTVSLAYNGGSLLGATITPMVGSTTGTAATLAPTGYAVVNYNLPSVDRYSIVDVDALATGPDGNLWYGTYAIIGKVTSSGQFTEFTNGVPGAWIAALTAGPDGNVWFGTSGGQVGKITPAGTVTSVSSVTLPGNAVSPNVCNAPYFMVNGPDGNIWFSDPSCAFIGMINPTTLAAQEWDITQLPGWPNGNFSYPQQIAFGPDGKLYAADDDGYIDQITIAGGAATGVVQLPMLSGCDGTSLTPASDGNIWFTDDCSNIGRVSPSTFSASGMAEWQLTGVTNGETVYRLVSTPGGLWATDDTSDSIYRINNLTGAVPGPAPNASTPPLGPVTSAAPTVTPIKAFASQNASPYAIALGPDGNIWTATNTCGGSVLAKVVYGVPTGSLSAARSLGPMVHGQRKPKGTRRTLGGC